VIPAIDRGKKMGELVEDVGIGAVAQKKIDDLGFIVPTRG